MESVAHDLSRSMKSFFDIEITMNLDNDISAENENMDKDAMIEHLKQRICQLEERNRMLTEEYSKTNIHLSKYTSPTRNVEYYHRTKETNKDSPDYIQKRKEINKRAYQKRKAKLLEQKSTLKNDSEL
jgi:hypothetical protein